MSDGVSCPPRWRQVLDRMCVELSRGEPRAEAYWAQQLAFAPVLIHAVALALRAGSLSSDEQARLRELMPLAVAALGALPDGSGGDPARLRLLAQRQAAALASGRRRHLLRLADRLGAEMTESPLATVPPRLLRAYPLIGWTPPTEAFPRIG